MQLTRSLVLAFTMIWLAAGDGAALSQPVSASPGSTRTEREERLEIVVDFFVPRRPLLDILTGPLVSRYRTQVFDSQNYAALEPLLPGVRERMADAASAAAPELATRLVDQLCDEVRAFWQSRLTDEDLAALIQFLGDESITQFTQNGIPSEPGDSARGALDRVTQTQASRDMVARFQRRQAEFQRTPVGQRLMPSISAYQRAMQPRLESLAPNVFDGMHEVAKRAANRYAIEHIPDAGPVFPDAR